MRSCRTQLETLHLKEMTLEFWIDVKLNTEDHLSYQSRFTRQAIYPIGIKEKNQRKESKKHEHPLRSYRLVYGDGAGADGVLPLTSTWLGLDFDSSLCVGFELIKLAKPIWSISR